MASQFYLILYECFKKSDDGEGTGYKVARKFAVRLSPGSPTLQNLKRASDQTLDFEIIEAIVSFETEQSYLSYNFSLYAHGWEKSHDWDGKNKLFWIIADFIDSPGTRNLSDRRRSHGASGWSNGEDSPGALSNCGHVSTAGWQEKQKEDHQGCARWDDFEGEPWG